MPEFQDELFQMTDLETRAVARRAAAFVQDLEAKITAAEARARDANADLAALRARLRDAREILGATAARPSTRTRRGQRAGGVVRAVDGPRSAPEILDTAEAVGRGVGTVPQ